MGIYQSERLLCQPRYVQGPHCAEQVYKPRCREVAFTALPPVHQKPYFLQDTRAFVLCAAAQAAIRSGVCINHETIYFHDTPVKMSIKFYSSIKKHFS